MQRFFTDGHPTLFGGDLTGYMAEYGARLDEAVFRVQKDIPGTTTHSIAQEEVEILRGYASDYGLDDEEFRYAVTPDGTTKRKEGMRLKADGELFIDSYEGQQVYMMRNWHDTWRSIQEEYSGFILDMAGIVR